MIAILKTSFFAIITIFFAGSLIFFPKQSLNASIEGFSVWSEIVFPSLLPFFIVSQLMIGFGVVQFIGVLLEPIMRPLFRVPGAGGFVWVLGMASGYPAGAKMTAQLREKNIVSQIEAERLISFTNASSPLFIFGAIAIGFFNQPSIGILLALSHYVSNALVGICMRFYGKNEHFNNKSNKEKNYIKRAFKQMHETRIKETRPFGLILSDSIISSINTLIMIGGFIMLFSVLTEMLQLFNVTNFMSYVIQPLFSLLSIPIDMANPFVISIFEITIGIKAITSQQNITLLIKLIIISFILGLNGFSVQAQVASVISHTDIRFFPYFLARILHGIFASILTFLLYQSVYFNNVIPIFSNDKYFNGSVQIKTFMLFKTFGPFITFSALLFAFFIVIKRLQIR